MTTAPPPPGPAAYTVRVRLTLAETRCGRVVRTRPEHHEVPSSTRELSELFAELYARFRGPHLLGLLILDVVPRSA